MPQTDHEARRRQNASPGLGEGEHHAVPAAVSTHVPPWRNRGVPSCLPILEIDPAVKETRLAGKKKGKKDKKGK